MITGDIINFLETVAPPALQEDYDNAGLIFGNPDSVCMKLLVCLDITDEVIEEAKINGANLIISHHPVVFRGIKKFNEKQISSRLLIKAIRENIQVYAIHTNLDNAWGGVSFRMADKLKLINRSVLEPKTGMLKKLFCFVPVQSVEKVRNALFVAGAGEIGAYSECSFSSEGKGTFKAGKGTEPFVGEQGIRHTEPEFKLELIYPAYREAFIIRALLASHPYEEVAYDIVELTNPFYRAGSGLVGDLPAELSTEAFLRELKQQFDATVVRHTRLVTERIKRVALCGGAGSFLISKAIASRADIFITADLKYHDYFEADGKIILADIGHYESEQFTSDLLVDLLKEKFPNFAVLKTGVLTNPVKYFL